MSIGKVAIENFLKKNNGIVYSYCWFTTIGNEHVMCEEYFLVKDDNIYAIKHDQTLSKDKINFSAIDKLKKVGKYNKNKKYIWNNYYFIGSELKKISRPTFNIKTL